MGAIIEHMARGTENHEPEGTRRRYEGICPVCGKKIYICKSLAMEIGINIGVGTCLHCKTFLHITFNPERQDMNLEKFEDYQANAKTN